MALDLLNAGGKSLTTLDKLIDSWHRIRFTVSLGPAFDCCLCGKRVGLSMVLSSFECGAATPALY